MGLHGYRWLARLGLTAGCTLAVACGDKRPAATPGPPPPPAPAVVTTPPAPPPRVAPPPPPQPPAPLTEAEIFARTSLAELNAQRPLGDAFFDYDRSDLSDPVRATLQHDADWMRTWNQTRVLIEGHADERGTSEYNLALGERRASAARGYLVSLGLDPSRISLVSKGKEAPFCTEHHEACWHENRRGHFIITAK